MNSKADLNSRSIAANRIQTLNGATQTSEEQRQSASPCAAMRQSCLQSLCTFFSVKLEQASFILKLAHRESWCKQTYV
jgi:hypothetical protein